MSAVMWNGERFISEAHIVNSLAQVYREDGRNKLIVATLCDDWLDPSGRLLGLVRDMATARLAPVSVSPETPKETWT